MQVRQTVDFCFRRSRKQHIKPVISKLFLSQTDETHLVSAAGLDCEVAYYQCWLVRQRLNPESRMARQLEHCPPANIIPDSRGNLLAHSLFHCRGTNHQILHAQKLCAFDL